MKKEFVAAGFVLFSFMLPLKATAANFSQVYVFGDSLSDIGNSFAATGIYPAPYSQGRSSNGDLWVQYLARDLGLNLTRSTNFAFAGATTGSTNTLIPGVQGLPGLQQQITTFTANNPQADPNALYILWAGANDYLGAGITNPTVPITNLVNGVASLATIGARNIMVANLPNLGQLPGTSGNPQISAGLSTLSGFHNSGLFATLQSLSGTLGSNVNIIPFDVSTLFSRVIANKEEFGFTNVTNSCLNRAARTICNNPNEYLFWDEIHPTTRGHSFIAQSALSTLKSTSVPEPSPALSILGLAALGAGSSLLKRKHKKASLHSSSSGS